MNKWWWGLLLSFSLHAEVVTLHTWEEVEQKLETLTAEDLAVFDVDLTLVRFEDPLLCPGAFKFIQKHLKERDLESYFDSLIGHVAQQFEWVKPLDPKIPATLNRLKERSIKCIALTAQQTGPLGEIPLMEVWRHNQLRAVGIDFSKGPFRSIYHFSQLGSGNGMPVFHDGILCSCEVSKGVVLTTFLDRVNFRPEKVLFIDDKMKCVEEVAHSLDERSIPNLCIHLRLIDSFDYALNEEKALKRLEIVLKEVVHE